MLHNSLPTTKKVHMQNISHVPIRIDWLVYDIDDDDDNVDDKTNNVKMPLKLIELISVVDNNPFDDFDNDETIDDYNDDLLSQITMSTSK
jgi:hypothetical protein